MMMSPAGFDDTSPNPTPVCSGPYQFVERVQNDRIVLEKFEDYWNADEFHFERLIFRGIPDNTVRFANLQSGDLDIIERIGTTDIEQAEANSALTVVPVTGLGYQALAINLRDADSPLADARVRRALDLAIDRDVINQVVGAGLFQPAFQPFPPASFAYDASLDREGRDVEAARSLLTEAGHERVAVEISFGNNTTMQQVLELVQAMASEAGFDITLRPTEFAALQGELREGRFQIAQSGWSGRVDPDGNIHQHVTCEGGLNDGRYCNERVDELLDDARSEGDVEQRAPLYAEAQEILSEEKPIVYLYYLPYPFAHTERLEGFVGYPDGMIRLHGVQMRD
jgi:peptide/nickel transport system substrate-binding protein